MHRRWVVNASPLIALAKIDLISVLFHLCVETIIPDGVAAEVHAGPEGDPARIWLKGEGQRFIRRIGQAHSVIAAWDLGHGESKVLSWVYEHSGYEAILDDRAARNCASALNLRFRGTLGIILLAKNAHQIETASPVFEMLVKAGFRIGPEVLNAAKKLAGEA